MEARYFMQKSGGLRLDEGPQVSVFLSLHTVRSLNLSKAPTRAMLVCTPYSNSKNRFSRTTSSKGSSNYTRKDKKNLTHHWRFLNKLNLKNWRSRKSSLEIINDNFKARPTRKNDFSAAAPTIISNFDTKALEPRRYLWNEDSRLP